MSLPPRNLDDKFGLVYAAHITNIDNAKTNMKFKKEP